MSMVSPVYKLALSDGSCWVLQASDGLSEWLAWFARIMRLPPSGPGPGGLESCLTFLPAEDTSSETEGPMPLETIVDPRNQLQISCRLGNPRDSREIEIVNMWNALRPVYTQSILRGGLPLHGALLENGGRAVVVAARGGGGKSTCCRRVGRPWTPLCDDEVLVTASVGGGYRAHPFPTWSDYLCGRSAGTWDVQSSVPLHGIFFLEQSVQDAAVPLGRLEAPKWIYESARQVLLKYWRRLDAQGEREIKTAVFHNAFELAGEIPSFHLKASLSGRFWEAMEQAMTQAGD